MPRFRKRPVVEEVTAEQFDPKVPREKWPFGVEWEPEFRDQDGSRLGGFHKLRLFGGFEFVHAGDWIIFGLNPRVMRDKEFHATYEPIEGER